MIIFSIIVGIFTSVLISLLIRSFGFMSISELERQAKSGDKTARKVYRARKHGLSLWLILWTMQGLLLSIVILWLDAVLWRWLALIIDVVLLVLIHVVLPWIRWPKPSLGLAGFFGPSIGQILDYVHPVTKKLDNFVGGWLETESSVRIHSKEELVEVLQRMTGDLDRIGKDEIKIAMHALNFGEKAIGDVMIPSNVIKTVSSDEIMTPIVRDELYKSGFSRIPVWQKDNLNYVGMLYLKDLSNLPTNKPIRDLMRPNVFYVNQDMKLDQVLNAFIKTHHHLFMVVNEFENIVGVISLEDVMEQILGKSIVDEFDQYDDLRVVARAKASEVRLKRDLPST